MSTGEIKKYPKAKSFAPGDISEYIMGHGTSSIHKHSSYHTRCDKAGCTHHSGPFGSLTEAKESAKLHEIQHNPFSIVTHIEGKKI